jgi:hypothetical protein
MPQRRSVRASVAKRSRRRRPGATAAPVRAAAARAVERVLSSPDAFALLVARLEAEGWRIEKAPPFEAEPIARER